METSEKIKEILKTMASFDVEKDLQDNEARVEFVNYFSEIVNTEDDIGQAFLKELIGKMGDILVDMNLAEPDVEETDEGDSVEENCLFNLNVADRANDFLME